MNSAKLSQIIVTQSVRGRGIDLDPSRIVIEFWSSEGEKLAEDDIWTKKRIEMVEGRLAQITDAANAVCNNCTASVRDKMVAELRELLEKFRNNAL